MCITFIRVQLCCLYRAVCVRPCAAGSYMPHLHQTAGDTRAGEWNSSHKKGSSNQRLHFQGNVVSPATGCHQNGLVLISGTTKIVSLHALCLPQSRQSMLWCSDALPNPCTSHTIGSDTETYEPTINPPAGMHAIRPARQLSIGGCLCAGTFH